MIMPVDYLLLGTDRDKAPEAKEASASTPDRLSAKDGPKPSGIGGSGAESRGPAEGRPAAAGSEEQGLESDPGIAPASSESGRTLAGPLRVEPEQDDDVTNVPAARAPKPAYRRMAAAGRKQGRPDTVQLPGFPRSLLDAILATIPSSCQLTQAEAAAAWIYRKMGCPPGMGLSKKILDAADTIDMSADRDVLEELRKSVGSLRKTLLERDSREEIDHFMLEWIVLERMAMIESPSIEALDFTSRAFDKLRPALRREGAKAADLLRQRAGRPMK